jgi:hypothetical protein
MGKNVFDELEAMSGMDSGEAPEESAEQQAGQALAPEAEQGQGEQHQGDDTQRQLQEERARRLEAEKARDDLIRQALAGMSGQQGQQGQQQEAGGSDKMAEVLENLDEDVAQAVTQLVQSENKKFVEQFMQQYGPVLEGVTRDQSIKEIDQRVEGFSNELMDEVEKEYQGLSDAEKQEYGASRAGIEALALRVKLRKMQEQGAQKPGASGSLPSMAQTTPGSRQFSQARGGEDRGFDPWSQSDEDFQVLLEKIQNGEVR